MTGDLRVEKVALTLIATRFDKERYPHLQTDGTTFAYQCKGENRELWKNALIEARAALSNETKADDE